MQSFVLTGKATPHIGDIVSAKETRRTGTSRYIWVACPNCGIERWMEYRVKNPRSSLCISCVGKLGLNIQGGEKHPRWKGGQTLSHGYVMLYLPRHPHANSHHYIKRARVVMEKHLGHLLTPEDDVHHINQIKTDDRIENLQVLSRSEHLRLHMTGLVCSEETKRRLSIALTGKVRSLEHCRHISEGKRRAYAKIAVRA